MKKIFKQNHILILFILLTLIPFYKINFGLIPLQGEDYHLQHFFWKYFLKNELLNNGTLPLWNPYNYCGTPFIANIQAGIFYPFTIIFFLFPLDKAYGLSVMLHLILGNIFMYIFLRKRGLSLSSSIFGVIIFMLFIGLWWNILLGWLPLVQSYIWIPLILHYYLRSFETKKYYKHTALVLLIQFLGGYPQIFYGTLLLISLHLVIETIIKIKHKQYNEAKNRIYIFCLTITFFLGLSAIQFLPTAEFIPLSGRGGGLTYQKATMYSPGLFVISGILISNLIPLLVILIFSKQLIKKSLSYVILSIFFLILSLGKYTPVYKFFIFTLPGLSYFRNPEVFFFILIFIIAYLTAISMDTFRESNLFKFNNAIYLMVFILQAVISFTPTFFLIRASDFYSQIEKTGEIIGTATKHSEIWERVIASSQIIPVNSTVAAGKENVLGYDPFSPKYLGEFMTHQANKPVSKVINLLGVKYIFTKSSVDSDGFQLIYDGFFNIYKYKGNTTRFYIAKKIIPQPKEKERSIQLLFKTSMEEGRAAMVEDSILSELKNKLIQKDKYGEDKIEVLEYSPNKIFLRILSASPGILVIKNNYHPGWKAEIDGKPQKVLKANYMFQGVFIESGKHIVLLKFFPNSFLAGIIITISTIILLTFLFIKERKNG